LVHAQDDLTDADNQLFEASANEDTDAALAALKAGANINARSKGGLQTPLMQSVLFGREKMVKFFLEQGADV
jgi:ankyrin repeat protein